MGGGGRYLYPKYVSSPAGGWWVQPSNWKANTAVVTTGISAIAYLLGSSSAARESHHFERYRKLNRNSTREDLAHLP
ncbi:hypothetical protein IW262DRAFT_1407650 [Armillaria fumosa]|nr:hypothetical protein IW262DRAFT_1407650 [Armillaria fumosa]